MTKMKYKKRASGYMCFAETRRPQLELAAGRKILTENLVKLVSGEWERLPKEEKQSWKERAKGLEPLNQKPIEQSDNNLNFQRFIRQFTNNDFEDDFGEETKNENGKLKKNKKRKEKASLTLLESLREEQKNLINRFDRSARCRFRDILADKLIWNEPEPLMALCSQFALLTVLCEPDAKSYFAIPKEFTVMKICPADDQFWSVKRFVLRGQHKAANPIYHLESDVTTIYCNEHSFVKHLNGFLVDCWNQALLVPVVQFQSACWSFRWLKHRRELHLKRPTKSTTLERIICMEDFLIVLKRLSRGSGDGWKVELDDVSFCEENFFNRNLDGHSAYDDMNIGMLTLQMSEEEECQRVDGEQTYGHVTKVASEYFLQKAKRLITSSP